MNKVILIGNLAADPETRTTQSGVSQCTLRLAVQRRFANQQGVREADFFNCIAFGKTAEIIEKLRIEKGTKLNIKGEVQNNDYEKDGVMHYFTQIIVDFFEFCESKTASADSAPEAPSPILPDGFGGNEDDLPF
jgi:single-strand DNA-binding protein